MYCVYKKRGETPLACLERVRREHGILDDVPMTYAGRLDPMAEGLMIILVGEECKDKEKYTKLNKTYEFEILVGFETDAYDLLGLVDCRRQDLLQNEFVIPENIRNPEIFQNTLASFVGRQQQTYPAYSSKTVNGKQLHIYAREGRADFVRPTHEVEIFSLTQTGTKTISRENLLREIIERISKVVGDFRQDEILEKWKEVLTQSSSDEFQIITCRIDCGSGTYVRQLVHDIGEKLGMPITTFSIKRTKVGEYELLDK